LRAHSEKELEVKLIERGQGHVLDWLRQLDAKPRRRLLDQLNELNLKKLDTFRNLIGAPPAGISFSDVEGAPVERVPLTPKEKAYEWHIKKLGNRILQADRVAVLTVAGGHGTRLVGYDHPKGMYPISPIRGASLFQLFAEQIQAARRRYDCSVPWLIMTSETNDCETRQYFQDMDYFGLGRRTVRFFVQNSNPILDSQGRLLRCEPDRLLVGPDGHGGVFEALREGDLIPFLREGGWDIISYFQVDNPLVTAIDPRFLGHHLNYDADFSLKVIPKRSPGEKLGVVVLRAGRPHVIEYIEMPEDVASERLPSGLLRFLYGSIAIHIISVPFIERVAAEDDVLPWHMAKRQYEIINEDGEKVMSQPGECLKFERFVFDALELSHACEFVEVRREMEFAPVKQAQGQNSPATARRLLQRQWIEWLQQAGAEVETPKDLSEPLVEISPLYAASPEELRAKIQPGWLPSFPLLLAPEE